MKMVIAPEDDTCDATHCTQPLTGPSQGYMIRTERTDPEIGGARIVRLACSPQCSEAILIEEGIMKPCAEPTT